MPVTREISVDSPLMLAARKRHNECPWRARRTIALTFDQLFELFSQDCNSFADIAKLTGVTRERIRQVYRDYFTGLFPHRPNGRKRVKLCILKRRVLLAKEAPADNDFLKKIMGLATTNGLNARRIHEAEPVVDSFFEKRLLINNRCCCLRKIARFYNLNPGTKYSRQYFRLHLSIPVLKANRFVVALVDIPGYDQAIYIFPADYFIRRFPKGVNGKVFYFPVIDRPVYNNHYPLISFEDYQSYRDAWHLLRN